MRLLPVLAGLLLIILGLTAYYGIPNPHDAQTVSTRNLAAPPQLTLAAGLTSRKAINVSVVPEANSTLVINMTITNEAGGLSQLDFRISPVNNSDCDYRHLGCIYQGSISNSTIQVPLKSSGSYYLIFDNAAGTESKVVLYTIYVRQNSIVETISHDGMGNWFGLGLGAIGALATLYGLSRKTIVPWE